MNFINVTFIRIIVALLKMRVNAVYVTNLKIRRFLRFLKTVCVAIELQYKTKKHLHKM